MGAFLSSSNSNSFHFPTTPVYFPVRNSDASNHIQRTSLRAFIESKCPSIFSEFRAAWYLRGGHLQTIYSVLGNFSNVDNVVYERLKYIRLIDGGTIGLDFTPVGPRFKEDTPLIVVLHGLTGGSYESYVRAVLAPACSSIEEGGLGYRAVVVNFRGCAGVPITSPQLYSAGYTDDLRTALMYITNRYPKAPLLGLGFSLGANVMTRYIAEERENCRLVAGCALGCPWDLSMNNQALEDSIIGRNIYSKGMGGNLQRLALRHAASLSKFADHRVGQALPRTLALKSPTMQQFDASFTRVAGGASPPFPFPTVHDYYAWASSHKVLEDVRVPFLAINAMDDPVVQKAPNNTGGNGWVALVLTPSGGHLGWFAHEAGEVKRWVRRPVLEWLRAVGDDLVHEAPRGQSLFEKDGFLTEAGREDLGCKEIDDGGLVATTEGSGGLLSGL